jgi:hypothetical protein
MRVPLNESKVVTLNGSGNATAQLGPLSGREVWYPTTVSVSAGQAVVGPLDAHCNVYVGNIAPSADQFRDASRTGSSGDSSGNVVGTIRSGQYIWAVWTGGNPGQNAYLRVVGEKDV